MTAPRPIVKPASEMDDLTIIKHLNARHFREPVNQGDAAADWPKVMNAWRGWHAQAHAADNRNPTNHDHREVEA